MVSNQTPEAFQQDYEEAKVCLQNAFRLLDYNSMMIQTAAKEVLDEVTTSE